MSSTATTPVTGILNYVGGAWRKSSASEFVNVTKPATSEPFGHIPISPEADVDAAVNLDSHREESPLF